jgi:GntR family transcriptional regulator
MKISKSSRKPVFEQVADALREQIAAGALRPGDAIPSERDLGERLKISRMTARAAVDVLVREGALVRQHGRATTVSGIKISKNALGFMSFTEDMQARGLSPSSKVLRQALEVADATVAAQLGQSVGVRVVFVERIRNADGEPMALERVYLPHDRFKGLLSHGLETRSLYEVLETEYDCRPSLAEESVEAVSLTPAEAKLLRVARGSPALLARRVTRDEHGEAIETVKTLYRADRYRMIFTRKR